MSPSADAPINIVGAGLAGTLLAIVLARRGYRVHAYERRPDPRVTPEAGGRSINLALAARGIRALELAGVMPEITPLLIPMPGRLVHEHDGSETFLPYGQKPHEVIYSVSRAALNETLIRAAARYPAIEFMFEHTCTGVSLAEELIRFRDLRTERLVAAPLSPTIATDGAGSAVRNSLVEQSALSARDEPLEHDYRELTIPAGVLAPPLRREALHIWPRGGFMLIALPNTDGSFTATLFLPQTGSPSFALLRTDAEIEHFFATEFPSARPYLTQLLEDFRTKPQGKLGTLHATPWHIGGRVLLLGDAAHAIVPFHGQGMNCAFEDVATLDAMLDSHEEWSSLFAAYEEERRPNTEAIARMALENYEEMRSTVLDPEFQQRKKLAAELEQRFPDRFIPRYSMVTFHPEIGYAEAFRRGLVQDQLLTQLQERSHKGTSALAQLFETGQDR